MRCGMRCGMLCGMLCGKLCGPADSILPRTEPAAVPPAPLSSPVRSVRVAPSLGRRAGRPSPPPLLLTPPGPVVAVGRRKRPGRHALTLPARALAAARRSRPARRPGGREPDLPVLHPPADPEIDISISHAEIEPLPRPARRQEVGAGGGTA
ncbi:hypothetical protein EMIHUDRAFT_369986 [Emiliania huxleyi CCMP1516]|uniref:Uncharacterized protein n=2 Tax=Emiliania huxleyi TaxID=2903 RepID=A0A0D3IBB5_EMIH1|nr:hypothetical protein EMIHUDRAFT_358796 [Emiliania huxleyi CCMP1516]XP_005769735.1 hypothetical protein EMIHUDRAFT_369986 [Emiliania huxleyi CCMP1516]EOD08550.1 hypothetical protein EMIHUDRAFT_358796 [Emiliania huxleyi CCMP1516]EOD17306.1 hypothetical protein EMIHUDRAFT_369986 [Emiliania huxleyi CCMP1516]|eukprot:XP_005760979.1 hypothetical protein EMIHUDRAFT_358796 [Emiliania huxleyi CCMP1516]